MWIDIILMLFLFIWVYTLLRTTEKALRRFFCLQFYTYYKLFMHIFLGQYSGKNFMIRI